MSAELILDPQIRIWVFLPIALIAFLVGILRYYLSILLENKTNLDLQQLKKNCILQRARRLQYNCKYLPAKSFLDRRDAFNNPSNGYLMEKQPALVQTMPLTDSRYINEILKGNFLNVVSMLLVGGWITLMFSGFLTTKVPFPLTLTFQTMLQRGIELNNLEASWVSSASWYFLNVFCLRGIHGLVFEEYVTENEKGIVRVDVGVMMKEEWEGLELIEHDWAMEDIEHDMLTTIANDLIIH